MAALAVFIGGCRRLGQALHLYLLNLALADVLFTLTRPLWLTYHLEVANCPLPKATCRAWGFLLPVHLRGDGFRHGHQCARLQLGRYPDFGPRATTSLTPGGRGPTHAPCATAWLTCSPALCHALAACEQGQHSVVAASCTAGCTSLSYATVAFVFSFLLVLAACAILAQTLAEPPGPDGLGRTGE